jgi:hypothetical protein
MPHQSLASNNKNSKKIFEHYLRNIDEPSDTGISDIPSELQAELLEDSYAMRRRFRLIAKTLRDYF